MTYSQAKIKFKQIEKDLDILFWAQGHDTDERKLFPGSSDEAIKEKFIEKFHEGLAIRKKLFELTGRHTTQ